MRNSRTLDLIVPAITIALVITLFEVIPMKNMMSISKPDEEHIAAVLDPGPSSMLMEEVRKQKAPTTSISNSNSKIKLVHQGFRIEEEVVRLLAEEANVGHTSVGGLVNTILKAHFKHRKYFEELGFIPVSYGNH